MPASLQNSKQAFFFIVCQHGAETLIKTSLSHPETRGATQARLAFSRPGLLTFKLSAAADTEEPSAATKEEQENNPRQSTNHDCSWAKRLSGISLHQLKTEDSGELCEQIVEQAQIIGSFQGCHIFARDTALPGTHGVEVGQTPLCQEIASQVEKRLAAACINVPVNQTAKLNDLILDVIMIEPNHWLLGYHSATHIHETWVGGVYPTKVPAHMVSRAYLKMAEALAWSQLPIQPGDSIVEIGSAPGGASQRLLDLGLNVTGVDPAEMDSLLLQHANFEHWRSKSSAVKRKRYSKFKWLAADANVAPNYTLDAVGDIVQYPTSKFAGLLLTLKLSSYELAEHLPGYIERVKSWGFQRVQIRQLASNRRECCLAASRN